MPVYVYVYRCKYVYMYICIYMYMFVCLFHSNIIQDHTYVIIIHIYMIETHDNDDDNVVILII